eukprot:CAMPEP_0168744804 /NCGR_PEP_ID=MMETSP0724-20121128/14282_1 /TAXON_ID=265536 /ORGANISM="Amphiprora sp., Strain CCMP467" /LENGTH=487 /DNA_ID=CAMNT_0008792479 /DNA_START=9 /DNA_END=1472 /DNA_ORIENTATION=-
MTSTSMATVTFQCPSSSSATASSSEPPPADLMLQAEITDLVKPTKPILTGVGFLDHMLDQLNSHAQIGVSLSITETGDETTTTTTAPSAEIALHHNRNRLAADRSQAQIFAQVATTLGTQLHGIMEEKNVLPGASSFFGCPLDEALVLVTLERCCNDDSPQAGELTHYNLQPYGHFPPQGRTHLGQMELQPLQDSFWQNVARHAQLKIAFYKIRGENAHHIVEAAFKAFSRSLRNLIDGINTTASGDDDSHSKMAQLYGPSSANVQASVALERRSAVSRKTRETNIDTTLLLDNGTAGTQVSMGLKGMDDFWTLVSQEARVSLQVSCHGDLWIDEHHTSEDVAIALGQVWNQALGTKAGLNRMWCWTVTQGTAHVRVILDLSNRPMLTHNLPLRQHGKEHLEDVPVEMLEHVLDSFVVNARMTLHVVVQDSQNYSDSDGADGATGNATLEDAWKGMAIALGRAMRYAILVDQRRAGATASSKGTLSV